MQSFEHEYPLYTPPPEHDELVVWHRIIEYLRCDRSPGLTILFHRTYDHLEQLTHISMQVYLPTKRLTLNDNHPNWSEVVGLLEYGITENIPEALHYILLYT